jgi:hypothetical protein
MVLDPVETIKEVPQFDESQMSQGLLQGTALHFDVRSAMTLINDDLLHLQSDEANNTAMHGAP